MSARLITEYKMCCVLQSSFFLYSWEIYHSFHPSMQFFFYLSKLLYSLIPFQPFAEFPLTN